MKSFSNIVYWLKQSMLLIIYFDNFNDMWSNEKAPARPLYMFLEN